MMSLRRSCFILTFLALYAGPLSAASSAIDKTVLFRAGEDGYASYRIPALTLAAPQTLLAACEARRNSGADWGDVEILMRRSEDAGRTWEPARPLVRQSDLPKDVVHNAAAVAAGHGQSATFTIGNPTWITDSASGATHLLYCVEYSRAFIITTRDAGRTFSEPREITATFDTFRLRDRYEWRVIATGPGHGVRLSTGRLVAPVWLSTSTDDPHHPSVCATIYSDDGGATWLAGEIAVQNTSFTPNPNESAIAEVSPSRVLFSARTESTRNRRTLVWSGDGATSWSNPVQADELLEPICMAALASLEYPGLPGALILFSNPASLEPRSKANPSAPWRKRQNLTLRASYDGGNTWTESLVLHPGPSAYSDLATSPDGTVYCFYECGERSTYETLTFARLAVTSLLSRAAP
jgi:Neuraminidase (sialidase)